MKRFFFGLKFENIQEALFELEAFKRELSKGYLAEIFPISHQHQEVLRHFLGDEVSSEDIQKRINEVIDLVFSKRIQVKDALGLSDQSMETFYFLAYQMYEQKKYHVAQRLFKILMVLDNLSSKYCFGFAACAHHLKDYSTALSYYLNSSILNEDQMDPYPHFQAADCCYHLDDIAGAITALGVAQERCKLDDEQHQHLKRKASVLIDIFSKELLKNLDSEDKENSLKESLESAKV